MDKRHELATKEDIALAHAEFRESALKLQKEIKEAELLLPNDNLLWLSHWALSWPKVWGAGILGAVWDF